VAVLGEMLELGPDSPRLHREVGEQAVRSGAQAVIAIGPGGTAVVEGARRRARTAHADTPEAAVALVDAMLEDGDVVLVKGSNGSGAWRVADALAQAGGLR